MYQSTVLLRPTGVVPIHCRLKWKSGYKKCLNVAVLMVRPRLPWPIPNRTAYRHACVRSDDVSHAYLCQLSLKPFCNFGLGILATNEDSHEVRTT